MPSSASIQTRQLNVIETAIQATLDDIIDCSLHRLPSLQRFESRLVGFVKRGRRRDIHKQNPMMSEAFVMSEMMQK